MMVGRRRRRREAGNDEDEDDDKTLSMIQVTLSITLLFTEDPVDECTQSSPLVLITPPPPLPTVVTHLMICSTTSVSGEAGRGCEKTRWSSGEEREGVRGSHHGEAERRRIDAKKK
jgi:hypothetical protein